MFAEYFAPSELGRIFLLRNYKHCVPLGRLSLGAGSESPYRSRSFCLSWFSGIEELGSA